jgi:hypothetical protein
MRHRWADRVGRMIVVAALLSACGDAAIAADPHLAPFVGDWAASELVVASPMAPDATLELIGLGATFTINIQPSGLYTAVLVFAGQGQTEIGQVSVSGGSTVILNREFPTPSREISTFAFVNADCFILEGDTEFDFNLDGTPEPALVRFVLDRR